MEQAGVEGKKMTVAIERKFKRAVDMYGLIPRGSTVIAAISGGKDSLCLLELLTRDKFRKHQNVKVVAAHVVMGNIPYHADLEFLEAFCAKRNIKLEVRKTSFDAESDKRKSPCFLCSWQRRKVLFDIAKEYDTNIIALGHHQDDMLETLMMNMAFQGSISSMPPKLHMDKFDVTMIRPLALLTNQQMVEYAQLNKFPKMKKECPHEETSFRSDIRGIIAQLSELSPKARSTMFASMTNIQDEYLPKVTPNIYDKK